MFDKVPKEDTSDTLQKFPEADWKDTHSWLGSVFAIPPELGMLVPGGMTKLRGRKVRERRQIVHTEFYNVRYDDTYVVEWIAAKVLKPLSGLPYNELQKLLSRAMQSHKSQRENGLINAPSYKGRSIDQSVGYVLPYSCYLLTVQRTMKAKTLQNIQDLQQSWEDVANTIDNIGGYDLVNAYNDQKDAILELVGNSVPESKILTRIVLRAFVLAAMEIIAKLDARKAFLKHLSSRVVFYCGVAETDYHRQLSREKGERRKAKKGALV